MIYQKTPVKVKTITAKILGDAPQGQSYYLAYGMNLNPHMFMAEPIEGLLIKDFQMDFKFHSTIMYKENSLLPVGLWKISSENEQYLDMREGAPHYYERVLMELDNGIKALIYRMVDNDENILNEPHKSYFNALKEGYDFFNLPLNHLYNAYRRSLP